MTTRPPQGSVSHPGRTGPASGPAIALLEERAVQTRRVAHEACSKRGIPYGSFAAGLHSSLAHDHWINHGRYSSPKDGVPCCGEDDCSLVPEESVTITAKGYLLRSGERIPFREALVSEDGRYCAAKTLMAAVAASSHHPPRLTNFRLAQRLWGVEGAGHEPGQGAAADEPPRDVPRPRPSTAAERHAHTGGGIFTPRRIVELIVLLDPDRHPDPSLTGSGPNRARAASPRARSSPRGRALSASRPQWP